MVPVKSQALRVRLRPKPLYHKYPGLDNAAGCLGWAAGDMLLAAAGASFGMAGGANWNWVWDTAGVASGLSSRGLGVLVTLILLVVTL